MSKITSTSSIITKTLLVIIYVKLWQQTQRVKTWNLASESTSVYFVTNNRLVEQRRDYCNSLIFRYLIKGITVQLLKITGMNETVQNTNYNLGFSLMTHSPVGSPQCRRLGCWPGSTGPHPWRARSSGASRRGRPRSCHRGGRSSTSAPGPAGGEARLVTRSGALRETDTVGADAAPWLHMTLSGYCGFFFANLDFFFALSYTWKPKMRANTDHGL